MEIQMQATCQGSFLPQPWMFDVHYILFYVHYIRESLRFSSAETLELWLTVVGAHWPARDAVGSDRVVASSSVHTPGLAWLFQQFRQGPKKRRDCTPSVSQQGTWQIRVSNTNQTWAQASVLHSVQVTSNMRFQQIMRFLVNRAPKVL